MLCTVYLMKHDILPLRPHAQEYAVLRQIGTHPSRAQVELGLDLASAARLEKVFKRRRPGGAQLPKFAKHDAHVAAVLAEGGFWSFSERSLGKGLSSVCLPLTPPSLKGAQPCTDPTTSRALTEAAAGKPRTVSANRRTPRRLPPAWQKAPPCPALEVPPLWFNSAPKSGQVPCVA